MTNQADRLRDVASRTDCDTGDSDYAILMEVADAIDALRKADKGCGVKTAGQLKSWHECSGKSGLCRKCRAAQEAAIETLTYEE